MSMKENFYSRNTRIKLKIKADSNPGRSFIPMVVSAASGFIFWRCFVFKPVSNRFKNRRTAPAGSYYPIVVKMRNTVSELKNILPVLKIVSLLKVLSIKNYTKPGIIFSRQVVSFKSGAENFKEW